MLDGRQFPTGESQGNDPESGALFGFQWNIIGRHLVPHLVLAWPHFLRRGSGHLLQGFQWVPSASALPVTSCQSVFHSGGQKKNLGPWRCLLRTTHKNDLKMQFGSHCPTSYWTWDKKGILKRTLWWGEEKLAEGNEEKHRKLAVWGTRLSKGREGWETKKIRDNNQQIHGKLHAPWLISSCIQVKNYFHSLN